MDKIFCIAAKTASGKDSLVSLVSEELQMPIATSFTTRPMRTNEINGREYYFITKEEFIEKENNGEIAEHTQYNVANGDTWHYGLTREELEKSKHILVIVNPDGLRQLEEMYKDKIVSILIECSDRERLLRAVNRDENANIQEICRRMNRDDIDFANVNCDYVVYNHDGMKEQALSKLKEIILEEIGE